jgi:hypothetical protein
MTLQVAGFLALTLIIWTDDWKPIWGIHEQFEYRHIPILGPNVALLRWLFHTPPNILCNPDIYTCQPTLQHFWISALPRWVWFYPSIPAWMALLLCGIADEVVVVLVVVLATALGRTMSQVAPLLRINDLIRRGPERFQMALKRALTGTV